MNPQPRELYEDMILDHNRHPRHYPIRPAGATHHAHGFNPLCNDEILLHLRIEDGTIRDIGFEGAGCAISIASASMLTEAVLGLRVADAQTLFERMHAMLAGAGEPAPGKLGILAGVREFPMRVKCATLAWHTLHAALAGRDDMVNTEATEPPLCAASPDLP
jgi:nitrogen fixation NifU-like protein